MSERRAERIAVAIALAAAAVRLIPLQWLHPLNWDELEFYRATKWIAEGRVPFRDFWEHHTPLAWLVFAPFAALTESAGAQAILSLRWAQIPVWIAVFWLTNVWMRGAGLTRFARWTAMAFALCSSFLMIAAVEYRVDPLAIALFMGAMVLAQRERFFTAGALFCLSAWANLRFAPLIAVAILLLLVWKKRSRAALMLAGAFATLGVALLCFAAAGALDDLWQQLVVDNSAEKFAGPIRWGFVHRLLVPFGVRILATDRLFELAAVDVGGIAVLAIGFTGLALALRRWRTRDDLALMAILQVASLVVIASMKFIYNYHFEIVIVMMIPLIASVIERRTPFIALLVVAFAVSAFASIFRGKELDLAYQDFVMREVDRRTNAGETVWGGITWALRREPPYRFWFLPELARQLVTQRLAPPYALQDVVRNPPAAVVFDHNALVWVAAVQRELAPFFVRHYIPVWRNVWVPGMNARVRPGGAYTWIVPRDGVYRVFASPELAAHRWFRQPLYVGAYDNADPSVTLRLPSPGLRDARLLADGVPQSRAAVSLRKGQRVTIVNDGAAPLGAILLPGDDTVIFRQPPPGATLEAATTRVTHVPDFNARIER